MLTHAFHCGGVACKTTHTLEGMELQSFYQLDNVAAAFLATSPNETVPLLLDYNLTCHGKD